MHVIKSNNVWSNKEDLNWGVIEVSKVTNKIIKILVDNLLFDLSENFFISFESLIKIGKRVKPILNATINRLSIDNWRRKLFKFILKYIDNKEIKNPLIYQFYNPDFLTRVHAIMLAQQSIDMSYVDFILPLVNDPDDSVRWAALNFFINQDQLQDFKVQKKLMVRRDIELNNTIQNKIIDIIKNKE